MLDLPQRPGAPAHRRFAERLAASRDALSGAEVVGLFAPQLGWGAHQAALLLRWPERAGEHVGAADGTLASAAAIVRHRQPLTPTLRPGDRDLPSTGGVYVHRWFTVRADSLLEFLALSSEGWADFEQRFDATIFGLFQAARTAEDAEQGAVRLLLLTRYGSHGVWEASRDPTTEAMKTFARRRELTLDSSAVSTSFVPPVA